MKTQHQRKRGLLGRKPESLCLSVHYSACLHHFLLVHKLPGSQESLMGACLTPNQFNSVMMSVLMSFRAPSSSFLQDVTGNLHVLIILSITLQEYVVFREGGGALVALAAEARALRGGAFLHPPPHPTLCLLRLTANEPSCADKVSTRGQEHPSAFKHMRWIEKLTTSEKVIKKRGRRAGEDKQREGNKQEPRWRYFSPTQSTNTQSCTTAAWRQEQRPCCATRTDVGKKG